MPFLVTQSTPRNHVARCTAGFNDLAVFEVDELSKSGQSLVRRMTMTMTNSSRLKASSPRNRLWATRVVSELFA